MYRAFFLTLARNETVKKLILALPLIKRAVRRFLAGETWDEARETVATLLDKGLTVSIDYLRPDTRSADEAAATVAMYLDILDRIQQEGWGSDAEISVSLTALGLLLPDGEQLASVNAGKIAAKAQEAGTRLCLNMDNPITIPTTIRVIQTLRETYPDVGCALQSNAKRTEKDCRSLDGPQSRTRLCKGAYKVPTPAAYLDPRDINLSYVRSLKILMEGEGVPLIATHDPIMIEIAQELAAHSNRGLRDFEFQMLYGIRTVEQERLVDLGHIVRIYLPFGQDWYTYVVRRLAERPSNLLFFIHALVG